MNDAQPATEALHAHGQQFGTRAVGANLLAPPDGEVNTIGDSMFPMHTFYWGDWYKQIVDPEQADQFPPMRSILSIDPAKLNAILVLETLEEGASVYRREP